MPRLDTLLVPKVETAGEIEELATKITNFEKSRDDQRVGIEVMIESAFGLVNVDSIATASTRVESLHFGVGDFSTSIGARSVDVGGSHHWYAHSVKQEGG